MPDTAPLAEATLTIDLGAIADNWRALDRLSGPGTETGAVVKADAYGLGLSAVGPALAAAGARTFFVAQAGEGAALRRILGPGPRIFVFAGAMAGTVETLLAASLIPLLNSPEQAARWESPTAPYGLQLDTGMHRLGFEPGTLPALPTPPALVMSHLASADRPGDAQNAAQRARFATLAAAVPDAPRSLAATGGILLGAGFHHHLTRPGIGLFGGLPFAAARPVVSLRLPVIQTRSVRRGGAVGYGASWTARRPSRVATLSAGYADGLLRALGNRARVFAGTRACPVIGRASMDLLTIDVTDLDAPPDAVDILGPQQSIDTLAAAAGTIGYEILTALGPRYHRRYRGASS